MRTQTGFLLLFLVLLTACGGSGGGETSDGDDGGVESELGDDVGGDEGGDDGDDDDGDDDEGDDDEGDDGDGTNPGDGTALTGTYRVLAYNDLGMHCADRDYSVFSILPPFNVVHAQVIERGREPRIVGGSEVAVTYRGKQDGSGSINTTSANQSGAVVKGNFWETNPATGNRYGEDLFGQAIPTDEGLLGQRMPGFPAPYVANTPQPFQRFDAAYGWFAADGVPILPVDDYGATNPYPLMEVTARDGAGNTLASVDVVLPVSDEADCQNCHAAGEAGADHTRRPDVDFVLPDAINDPQEVLRAAKVNVLRLHDALHGTDLDASRPVLCAGCHYSAALDLEGAGPDARQQDRPTLSEAMHRHHGGLIDPETGNRVFPADGTMAETCYQCHPGDRTQCLRGAMGGADMTCRNCHGGMLAVGGRYPLAAGGSLDGTNNGGRRRPWLDLPRCQSCHTGDALSHQGTALRQRYAFDRTDPAASPRRAANRRFAEEPDTLYRNSLGHGGVACEGCHGSTHAIWPNADPQANDNVTARQLQGHTGTLGECDTCHTGLPPTDGGPHGMHNVADAGWMDEHGDFYERGRDSCRACHGVNLQGTPLSRALADRNLPVDDDGGRTRYVAKGTEIGCGLCHD